MKVLCAWCGCLISDDGSDAVSHGMCSDCRLNPELLQGQALVDFAETFSFPVVVMNSDLVPVAVNRPAWEVLPPGAAASRQATMGAIVECEHSKDQARCGETIHCTGCVLRDTVTTTNETGKPFTRVPAKLTRSSGEVSYLISTTRMDGHVLVKLERLKKE